jgi:PhnB protein
MSKLPIPADYQMVMPYLIIPDPEAFLKFSKAVLGATERMIRRAEDGSFGHAEIAVGDSVIMFSGSQRGWEANPAGLFVYVADADAAFAAAIDLGATEVMPVSGQSYGRSGGVKDTNGNTWWLTSPLNG